MESGFQYAAQCCGNGCSVSFDLDNYNSVPERMTEFFQKYPEGSFKQVKYELLTAADMTFIVYTAAAYRTPDDMAPGEGTAWEPVPGRTTFTKFSEMQNAETSAWGRAILAVGAADTRKGIASREEVQNRRADQDAPPPSPMDEALGALQDTCILYGLDATKTAGEFFALHKTPARSGTVKQVKDFVNDLHDKHSTKAATA